GSGEIGRGLGQRERRILRRLVRHAELNLHALWVGLQGRPYRDSGATVASARPRVGPLLAYRVARRTPARRSTVARPRSWATAWARSSISRARTASLGRSR